MTPQDFIATLGPPAQASAKLTDVPASFVVAEGALESGWGSSELSVQGKNIFGVKADPSWHGDILTMKTREYIRGVWIMVPARWRKYDTWDRCIADHAAFLRSNQRYSAAFQFSNDAVEFTRHIATAGYATDPGYADKICALMQEHNLTKLDD